MPATVFISHATVDRTIATTLKEVLETALLGGVDCFVSSDRESIPPGLQWFDEIRDAILRSRLALVLCSPMAHERPWINFEAGAAYFHGLQVVPVLMKGLSTADLRAPLSTFQAIDTSREEDLVELVRCVADAVGLQLPKKATYIKKMQKLFANGVEPKELDALAPARQTPMGINCAPHGGGVRSEPLGQRLSRILRLKRVEVSLSGVSWYTDDGEHELPGREGQFILYIEKGYDLKDYATEQPPRNIHYVAEIDGPADWDNLFTDIRLLLSECEGAEASVRFVVAGVDESPSDSEIMTRWNNLLLHVPKRDHRLYSLQIWSASRVAQMEKDLGIKV